MAISFGRNHLGGKSVKSAEFIELELTTLKENLLSHKSEILNKVSEFRNEKILVNQDLTDEAEVASLDQSNELSIHLHERDRAALLMIEKALSRIEAGSYTECESCGADIAFKRLQARPFTHLCIDCMEEQDTLSRSLQ